MRRMRVVALLAGLMLVGLLAWHLVPDTPAKAPVGATSDTASAAPGSSSAVPAPLAPARRAIPGRTAATDPRGRQPPLRPCERDHNRALERTLAQLPAATTVEDALGRALVRSTLVDPHETSRELAALARQWPDDPRVAWMGLNVCRKDRQCDDAAWIRRLLAVDGDNAQAWLVAMETAVRRHDDAGVALALRRAAQAPRYAPPDGMSFKFAWPIFRRAGTPQSCLDSLSGDLAETLGFPSTAEDWADIWAQGLEMAQTGLGVSVVTECDPRTRRLSTARREDCITALRRMALGRQFTTAQVATKYLILLLGPRDSAPWREHYRRLRYLHAVLIAGLSPPRGFLHDLAAEGEIAVWQAHARANGLWPPPADWLPENDAARRLILEGR